MQLGSYLGLARRWWFTFLLAVVVGAAAGWLAAGAIPVVYKSETRVLVGPINSNFDTLRASSQLAVSYADLATSEQVLNDAIRAGGLALTSDQLAPAVHATPNDQARTIAIDVELPSADESARAANAIADALAAYTAAGSTRPEGELHVIDHAAPAPAPAAPRTALIVLLAALGALLGALLVVSTIEYLDRTIRDADQLERVAGPSLLAVVPVRGSGGRLPSLAPRGSHGPPTRDPAYRTLLADLLARAPSPVHSLLVVSASDGADGSQVSAGLAAAAAHIGLRLVVVDAADEPDGLAAAVSEAGGGMPHDERLVDGPTASTGSRLPERIGDVVPILRDRPVHRPEEALDVRDRLLRDDELVIVYAGSSRESFSAPIWAQAVDSIVVVLPLGRGHRDDLEQALERFGSGDQSVWVVGTKAIRRGTASREAAQREASPAIAAGYVDESAEDASAGSPASAIVAGDAAGAATMGSPREGSWQARNPRARSHGAGSRELRWP